MKKIVFILGFVICFISVKAQQIGTFKDSRDGKVYKTVSIGSQIWLAENLAYKVSSGCWAYNGQSNNISVYGYLYNWETAKNVCPSGWHLPSDGEWRTLEYELGMSINETNKIEYRGENIGTKLKSTELWKQNNGNNKSRFNAVPSSYRNPEGSFDRKDISCYWWCSTQWESNGAWLRGLEYNSTKVYRSYGNYCQRGLSVRCVKD